MRRNHSRPPAALWRPTRRDALGLGLGAAGVLLAGPARAAPLVYALVPKPLAEGVWMVAGANEPITAENGGAIANIAILDTADGAVLIDSGPSHRYGEALKALAEQLTRKPVVRIYLTHVHTDHVLGATAFDPGAVAATPELIADLHARGPGLTDAMYRVAGDWMRGTGSPEAARALDGDVEQIGGRRLRFLRLSGHTASDLAVFDERSGLLFAGDLVFLDRAPTTPDALPAQWRIALDLLAGVPNAGVVPGHGPVETGQRGIGQTRDWLDMVEDRIGDGYERGLDATELMAAPLPAWAEKMAVARYEFARSTMHLLPKLEAARLPLIGRG